MQKSRLNRIGIMPSIMFPSGEISWSRNFSQRTAHISQMRQNLIGKHCGFIDGTVIPLNPALSACGKAIGSAIFVNVHFNGTTHHYNAKRWWLKICLGNSWDLEIVPLGWDQRSNSFLFLRCLFIPFVPHKNCLAARDLRKREGRQREAKELSLPLVANEPLPTAAAWDRLSVDLLVAARRSVNRTACACLRGAASFQRWWRCRFPFLQPMHLLIAFAVSTAESMTTATRLHAP